MQRNKGEVPASEPPLLPQLGLSGLVSDSLGRPSQLNPAVTRSGDWFGPT